MAQVRVVLSEDGRPQIQCPTCDEIVTPIENPIFDDHSCPECEKPLEPSELRRYLKVLSEWNDENGGGYLE